ncbi:MAG TPA: DUF305 domain-containing protein [Aeromicrobium sp.]|nr:DUF305 domain-containing protein [Aeromicrobium sp.]
MRRIAFAAAAGLALVAAVAYVLTKGADDGGDTTPSTVDIGFAQDMIVHHQQAVLMAAYTREHAGSDEVRALAGAIDSAQQREIGQMTGWLQSWGKPLESDRLPMSWMADEMPGHMHDELGAGSMPGMASPAEMDRLVNLTGKRLDVQFLRLMIRHHEGGLPMAKDAASHARTGYVRNTARTMIQDQQREIDQMQTLLQARGASPER